MNEGRYQHASLTVNDSEKVYVFCGYNKSKIMTNSQTGIQVTSIECLDIGTSGLFKAS